MVKLAAASSKKLQERGSIASGPGRSLAMCIVGLRGIDNGGLVARECGELGIGRKFGVALDAVGNIPCLVSVVAVAGSPETTVAVVAAAVADTADAVDGTEIAAAADRRREDRGDGVVGG